MIQAEADTDSTWKLILIRLIKYRRRLERDRQKQAATERIRLLLKCAQIDAMRSPAEAAAPSRRT
jgi:hypothetical protein